MKAIGYVESLPISAERALFAFEAPDPVPGPRDLLVRVAAISVNPVDTSRQKRAVLRGAAGRRHVRGTLFCGR